jgi:cyanophycin synthetase
MNSINEIFNEKLQVGLQLTIPNGASSIILSSWAPYLIESKNWTITQPRHKDKYFQTLQDALLTLVQELLVVGNLPVFDFPKIISVSDVKAGSKIHNLQIELPLINEISPVAYRLAIQIALDTCLWMSCNPPLKKSIEYVYRQMYEHAVKPIRNIAGGRKSTIPILRIAHSLDIPIIHVGLGVYQLGWGSKGRYLHGSVSDGDCFIASGLTKNKATTAQLLRLAGLPAPVHMRVNSIEEASKASSVIGFPVVVKPLDQERGIGVTVDIRDDQAVRTAYQTATTVAKSQAALIERQVQGVCHRIFIASGKLLYVVKRLPISVTGDGKRSIQELVETQLHKQSVTPPWKRSEFKPLDLVALEVLSSFGIKPDTVLEQGKKAPLRRIESDLDGGQHEDVTTKIHPDNLDIALRAAQLFGLDTAGIDIITTDISIPWHESGAIINEVNFAPLLGRTEVTRTYIEEFLRRLVNQDGKIPIQRFVDEKTSRSEQAVMVSQGLRAFLTTASWTITDSGDPVNMPFVNLNQRIKALACRNDVDAIIVVDASLDLTSTQLVYDISKLPGCSR